jgi:hypothetical protein
MRSSRSSATSARDSSGASTAMFIRSASKALAISVLMGLLLLSRRGIAAVAACPARTAAVGGPSSEGAVIGKARDQRGRCEQEVDEWPGELEVVRPQVGGQGDDEVCEKAGCGGSPESRHREASK